ncbi:hypothetical protein GcC1_084025 [Golovinomyces cichoracearum]|uniref:Transcription factor TFIIIC triple barrel domain-containing protein n=1 Tax=Golovinomyces cichoracearum TaxID=62708 RepID=A0A420IJ30_9PEZI|nr:hypothetical protein GcC1_084025 [Golovinomyces cichoracearum]
MEGNNTFSEHISQDPGQTVSLPAACSISISDDEDDDDQWEYEYSKDETETYYLTLDLSTPEVPPTHLPFDDSIRKKTRWLNPSIGRHRRQTPMPSTNRTAKTYTLDGRVSQDENEPSGKGTDDENENTVFHALEDSKNASKSVQILDLESNLPIIAFDGNVYACSWAENIGTELVFTPSDADNSIRLPKLRNLKGNVDLLACCTARLVARTLKLANLQDNRHNAVKIRDKSNVLIPVGHGASQQRKNQAHFLEKLALAKEKLGELDSVTVNAKPRLPPRKLRALFEEKREQERTELRRELDKKTKTAEEIDMIKAHLEEMDREDAEWAGRGESFAKVGRCGGRPKKVPLGSGDRKITKSTLWSQRNTKRKRSSREKALCSSPEDSTTRKKINFGSVSSGINSSCKENMPGIDEIQRHENSYSEDRENFGEEQVYDDDNDLIYGENESVEGDIEIDE